MAEPAPLLSIQDLRLAFGGLQVLAGVSVSVGRGEILALVGPNGAGKTSLLNCVNGLYRPDAGRILYAGEEITGWPPHRVAGRRRGTGPPRGRGGGPGFSGAGRLPAPAGGEPALRGAEARRDRAGPGHGADPLPGGRGRLGIDAPGERGPRAIHAQDQARARRDDPLGRARRPARGGSRRSDRRAPLRTEDLRGRASRGAGPPGRRWSLPPAPPP